MTRVLLLDTSFAARPIHDWLLGAGYDVWVIGNRPSDPLAMRSPSRYLEANYADIAATQSHIDRLGITYVVPGCTDVSIESAIQLRGHQTNFDSVAGYGELTNKAQFRALCARLGVPAPMAIDPQTLPVAGKLIVKPVDSFSGRGISVFDGQDLKAAEEALSAARKESRSGEVIVETFVEGELFSYSAFIEAGKVAAWAIVREFGSVTPYAVDTSFVSWDFPSAGEATLKLAIERLAHGLGLVDGLVHSQFIWDGERPVMIEITRRCPGDLYAMLIELSAGWAYAGRYASYFVGRPLSSSPVGARRHILRHTVTADHQAYEGFWPQAPMHLAEFHALAPVGREAPPKNRIDRVGLIFAEYSSQEALVAGVGLFADRGAYQTRRLNRQGEDGAP